MAVVLGTSSGFVTVAPTGDPAGTDTVIDGASVVTKHTSPAGAVKITQIGWYRGSGTNAANFEIALYADSAGVAGSRLFVDNTNSSTSTGWINTAVDWAIDPSTAYWLGLQMDAHTGSSNVDTEVSGGAGIDRLTSQTALNDPYGGGAVLDADGMYAVYALVLIGSAAITGTATASIGEADIVTGGKTIIITLTNDTWVASGATFDGQRQNIINGIDSAQSEATGWDAVVKAGLAVTAVARTSDTVVTVTLSAFATYDITAQETITVTVPTTATTSGNGYTGSPTFTVAPTVTSRVKDIIGSGLIPFRR